MNPKYLISTLVLLIACVSFEAHALSIGNMQMRSSYGQPLHAVIDIPSYTPKEIESLTVNLASPEAYKDAGLDWLSWFSQLSLTVRYDQDSKPYIALRTTVPIAELTLSFIIEFNWKEGRTVKQFDALLSPSMGNNNQSQRAPNTNFAATPAEKESTQVNRIRKKPVTNSSLPGRYRSKLEELGNGRYSYGPVLPGQSLSNIAEKFAPYSQHNLHQRMEILFQLNPQAFTSNHLGSLKAGYVLSFSDDVELTERPTVSDSNRASLPIYEENSDSIQQFGQVVRMEEQTSEAPSEAELLQSKLTKTRKNVEEYRKTNNELRSRLTQLEEQLQVQAEQLGIIEPEPLP